MIMKTADDVKQSEPSLRCFWFHQWSKWEAYKQPIQMVRRSALADSFEWRQKRQCLRCGRLQDEWVG